MNRMLKAIEDQSLPSFPILLSMSVIIVSGVLAAKTPEEAAEALTGTYATDPNYGKKLLDRWR